MYYKDRINKLTQPKKLLNVWLSVIRLLSMKKQKNTTLLFFNKLNSLPQSASPDELALVNFAKFCGFSFTDYSVSASSQFMNLSENGENKRYELLYVLKFNSVRKRMSVIIRDANGRLILYMKGADCIMLPRCEGLTYLLHISTD